MAELSAGAIDGRNASADVVRARLGAIGVETVGLAIGDRGTPLAPRDELHQDHGARMHRARDVVTAAIAACKRTGQHLDVRKLDAFEVAAYRQLRGLDPS
jgi:hypothetical protein